MASSSKRRSDFSDSDSEREVVAEASRNPGAPQVLAQLQKESGDTFRRASQPKWLLALSMARAVQQGWHCSTRRRCQVLSAVLAFVLCPGGRFVKVVRACVAWRFPVFPPAGDTQHPRAAESPAESPGAEEELTHRPERAEAVDRPQDPRDLLLVSPNEDRQEAAASKLCAVAAPCVYGGLVRRLDFPCVA